MELSSADKPKEMQFELEELRRELERLRKENAEFRRRLGISVGEPTLNYHRKSDEHPLGVTPGLLLTRRCRFLVRCTPDVSERTEPWDFELKKRKANNINLSLGLGRTGLGFHKGSMVVHELAL